MALHAGCGRGRFADLPVPDGPVANNVVFATNNSYNGNLGGLSGADATCAQAAQSGGLSGTFVAWLSSSTVNAANRLVLPGTSDPARGWVRTDGRPVADTVTDLLDGSIYYPIRYDEMGNDLAGTHHQVLTGTIDSGALDATAGQCSDWTVADAGQTYTYGDLSRTMVQWTNLGTNNCSTNMGHIYCFQVDHDAPLAPVTAPPGRIAFISDTKLAGNAGTSGADTACANEAVAHRLAGTFLALMATKAQAAATRFDGTLATWVRVDGIPLAATAGDVLAFTLDAPLNVDADGAYRTGHTWSGSTAPGTVAATNADDCADWTSAAAGQKGDTSVSVSTAGYGTINDTCDTKLAVYCLQQ